MEQKFDLQAYFSGGVERLTENALRAALEHAEAHSALSQRQYRVAV